MTQNPSTPFAALARSPWRAPRLAAALAVVLAAGAGWAAGVSDRSHSTTTMIERPGPGTNRIEVTGNSASNVQVRCADGTAATAGANINSVDIDSRALQGRTVVVTGRNTRDVKAGVDCAPGGAGAAANVNSVNIR
ncbi:hypothetical protein [Pseudacidovorax sp. RU35E]|uniref:hypothetical protein n=1 Tax=Pseudacidovorax sp. RU35E TaxID=1907403 RepID=UPI000956C12B|nr:hypothetical protein [Pseudacidovorax sp. RU35E]SIQ71725.1 hypothetical protein SAMN05880557_105171 [Pseudacidovorax sp. RU35E]